jgi:hypothetical protein
MTDKTSLDLLGRLLASENIRIVRKKADTASFNVFTRELTLPLWEEISKQLETLLIAHEVGHAIWTTEQFLNLWNDPFRPHFHGYANICEDARIERMIKEKFPGLKKDFFVGYNEILKSNFFGTEGKDLNTLNFIDRINLHFKLENRVEIDFSTEEQTLVTRLTTVKTEDEVLKIAQLVYDMAEKSKSKQTPDKSKTSDPEQNDNNASPSEEGSENVSDSDFGDLSADDLKNDPESMSEKTPSGANDKPPQSLPEETGSEKNESIVPTTQDMMDKGMRSKVDSSKSKVYNLKPELAQFVKFVPLKTIVEEFKNIDVLPSSKYLGFMAKNSKLVTHMVQEFERKKSAEKLKSSKIANSGALDMKKIFKYKIADEIFKQYKIEAASTDHGFVMLLDYSKSMTMVFSSVMEQVITLVQFCSAVDIKFEVLAFTNSFEYTREDLLNGASILEKRTHNLKLDELYTVSHARVSMLQFYKSGMKKSEINLISGILHNYINVFHRKGVGSTYQNYKMGATPLVEALLYINDYLDVFKAKNNTQKNTLIILTDGFPTDTKFMSGPRRLDYVWPSKSQKIFISSKKNNIQYSINLKHGNVNVLLLELQQTLIDLIAGDHPDTKLVGIFVTGTKTFSNNFDYYTHTLGLSERIDAKKHARYAMKKEGFYEFVVRGYNKFFIVPVDMTDENVGFDKVVATMTASQIARVTSGRLLAQKMARVMSSKLIAEVA